MMPIKEAIVGKLRESGPCSLDMSSRPSPISVGKRCSVPLMGCRETDGCYFAKAVTRPISFHSARNPVPKPCFLGLIWNGGEVARRQRCSGVALV